MEGIEFTPDYAFTDALIAAWENAARATATALAPVVARRGTRLPGVYENPRCDGLYARFCRRVDGKRMYIPVAKGRQGDYSKAEEERLHQLWVEACEKWDTEHGL